MSDYDQRFGGIARLYGREGLERLREAHVAVVGIGGVGSWAAEALARSGVGRITLIDLDDICITNTNRQVHAVAADIGRLKVEAMRDRIAAINPDCRVTVEPVFLTAANVGPLLAAGFSCVLDAIDNVANKCHLIAACRTSDCRIVTTGGAGGRIDPTQLRVGDLAHVTHDPLIRQVRRQLRREHGFPDEPKTTFGVPCVYSPEPVRYPWRDGSVCLTKENDGESLRLDCDSGYGSATFVTGAFGFAAAAEVLRLLTAQPR
ncbi:MAG TPA: tRNA cyclic N6-threonylcarbamoyladenosine(37) synthase TcdA [Verrucomicrobiales bacterium]|nr:tRNA cyclic N6-threonylcarbamoyladenosine(37) synthase TcdA [Verrucomicrobiales bacterium]